MKNDPVFDVKKLEEYLKEQEEISNKVLEMFTSAFPALLECEEGNSDED